MAHWTPLLFSGNSDPGVCSRHWSKQTTPREVAKSVEMCHVRNWSGHFPMSHLRIIWCYFIHSPPNAPNMYICSSEWIEFLVFFPWFRHLNLCKASVRKGVQCRRSAEDSAWGSRWLLLAKSMAKVLTIATAVAWMLAQHFGGITVDERPSDLMRTEVFIKIQCASFWGFIVWLVHDQWKKRQNLYELILFRDLCHPLSDENSQADPTLQFSVNWRKVSILRFLWNLSQNQPRLAWWSGPQSEDSLNMPVMGTLAALAACKCYNPNKKLLLRWRPCAGCVTDVTV